MKALLTSVIFAMSLLGQQQSQISLPNETFGSDMIVEALVSAFDRVDVVALGEYHARKADSDLRIRLVHHPAFAQKVRFIVVEFGSTSQQPTLDRYIRGENVSLAELQQVWKTTTQINGVWDSPVYADFLSAVRDVNKSLPAGARIRVLAGDPPTGSPDILRDVSAVSILQKQVLDEGGKALLLYGAGHVYRTEGTLGFLSAFGGGIIKTLEVSYPGRSLVVIADGGPYPEFSKFERALKTTVRPVLVSLGRSPFRDFTAEEFLGRAEKRLVNGEWTNAFQGSSLTLGQMADAYIYLGMTSDVETRVLPDRN